MSIPDNKKKRDNKNSETEKEAALAKLQDRFLGASAPKTDFFKKPKIGISPALLPKKDRVNLPTTEQAQNFGDHQLPLSSTTTAPLSPTQGAQGQTTVSPPEQPKPIMPLIMPEIKTPEPMVAPEPAQAPKAIIEVEAPAPKPDSLKINIAFSPSVQISEQTPTQSSPEEATSKPLNSFAFLDVGTSQKAAESKPASEVNPEPESEQSGVLQKAKSFLAHFAKKNKKDE